MEGFAEDGLSRFMKLQKIARGKHLLLEIYKEPLPVQNRKSAGNSSVYLKYIELIIMKYLSQKYGTQEVIFSRRKLWLLLGMINKKYRRISNESLLELKDDIITVEDIDSFYIRANNRLNRILNTALNNLNKRKLIDFEERTIICKREGSRYYHVIASKEEREKIISLEYDILREFGCENISEIIYRKYSSRYFKRITEIIKEKYQWDYYYKAYSIVFNHKNIQESIPRLEESLDEAIQHLNEKIIKALNKEAETIYKRDTKKYNELLDELAYDPTVLFKLSYIKKPGDNYLIAQSILADELINISKEDDNPDNMFDITSINDDLDYGIEELDELFGSTDSMLYG